MLVFEDLRHLAEYERLCYEKYVYPYLRIIMQL